MHNARLETVRQANLGLVKEIEPTIFVTFNFGYQIKPDSALPKMLAFGNRVERASLGPRWFKKDPAMRMRMVGFLERPDLNPHWHAVASAPEPTLCILENKGPSIWLRLERRGQLHVERIRNLDAVATYITKAQRWSIAEENMLIYGPIG